MRVLKNQEEFETPASLILKGYSAPGAIGREELEEAAMRILYFSRESGHYVSVSKREIELQFNRSDDAPSLCKAVGGLPRLLSCVQRLVDSGYLVEEGGEYTPTPKLVSQVYQAGITMRRRTVSSCE